MPVVSNKAKKSMRKKTRQCKRHFQSGLSLEEIARDFNPVIQGWISYYERYVKMALIPIGKYINAVLVKRAIGNTRNCGGCMWMLLITLNEQQNTVQSCVRFGLLAGEASLLNGAV
jgi:hypothetical protein